MKPPLASADEGRCGRCKHGRDWHTGYLEKCKYEMADMAYCNCPAYVPQDEEPLKEYTLMDALRASAGLPPTTAPVAKAAGVKCYAPDSHYLGFRINQSGDHTFQVCLDSGSRFTSLARGFPSQIAAQSWIEDLRARMLAEPTPTPDVTREAKMRDALAFFMPGGEWGKWKAWIVEGAPTREEGIAAAKEITRNQSLVEGAMK